MEFLRKNSMILLAYGSASIGCNTSSSSASDPSHGTSDSGGVTISSTSEYSTGVDSTTSTVDCPIPFPTAIAQTCETFEGLDLCYIAEKKVKLDAGKYVLEIDLADLNDDGSDDVIVTYSVPFALHVFLSIPGCGFSEPIIVTETGEGAGATSLDVNRDSLPDIVVNDNPPRLFLNKGQGLFSERPITALEGRLEASADFNNDTHPDIIGVSVNRLDFLFGDGDGGFTLGPQVELAGEVTYVESIDLNEDGYLDLVACQVRMLDDFTGILEGVILFGDPELTFSTFVEYDVDVPFLPYEIATGDFNRDGHADFAAGGYVRLGDGHGQFLSEQAVPAVYNQIEPADFDNDGFMDLLVMGNILLNRGGSFSAGFENIADLGYFPGNFNGDEYVDLVSLPKEGESTYLTFTLGVAPP